MHLSRCAYLALFLLGLSAAAAPKTPDWLTADTRASLYPDSAWIVVGPVQESVAPERPPHRCEEIVAEAAQAELARALRVRIESAVETSGTETVGAAAPRFDATYSHRSRITSDLELLGRKLETFFDAKNQQAYALGALERAPFAAMLRDRADRALAGLAVTAATAELAEATHPADARTQWARIALALREAAADLEIARVVANLPAADAPLAARLRSQTLAVAVAEARLQARAVDSLDSLAFVLADQLTRSLAEGAERRVIVPPFRVAGAGFASPLGTALASALTTDLGAQGWNVLRPSAAGPVAEAAKTSGANAVVRGETRVLPTGALRCDIAVLTLAEGRQIAAANAELPAAALATTGLAAAPQNAAAALADQHLFTWDDVVGGVMQVEVWTAKPEVPTVFQAGETTKLFVRVDRPCFLRIVYHLADGTHSLLVDNLFIDAAKVNRPYELPETFEIAAPFGVETIQANVSTHEFAPLSTRQKDGYTLIVDDLAAANAKTRGMKLRKAEDAPVQQAEARLVVTTMPAPDRP